jgi:hypothetical protein
MKLIRSLAFGATAIMAATFSSAASAKADNVGVYVGSDGFGLQFSSHDRGYYGGNYYGGGYYGPANHQYRGYHDRCRNKHYRRTHRHCWNGANYYNGGYYNGGYSYGYQPNHSLWIWPSSTGATRLQAPELGQPASLAGSP